MFDKKSARLRRARSIRSQFSELGRVRLGVHRTHKHIYAQLITPSGNRVLASASTTEKEFQQNKTGNVDSAKKIGAMIAERAKTAGVKHVVFDRSGFKYHGRVKALAESAREGGLEF